ncbi:MAG: GntR family transcriptional regulator [Microbacteriaceae bacterium]
MQKNIILETSEQSIYDKIRAAIFSGEFSPGSPLVESALAEQYGVSRTPVREAIFALEKDGFLEQRGRHLVVRITSLEDVMEIYDCRIVLEATAAKWAARGRSNNDLILLDLAHQDIIHSAGASPLELVEVNQRFHERVWRASQNKTLVELLTKLETHTRLSPQPTVSQPGRWDNVITEHQEMIDAIRDRDSDRAYQLASDHMKAARDIKIRMLTRNNTV